MIPAITKNNKLNYQITLNGETIDLRKNDRKVWIQKGGTFESNSSGREDLCHCGLGYEENFINTILPGWFRNFIIAVVFLYI